MYEEGEWKKNGYRFVIRREMLRRVLMYRGNEINVGRIRQFKET